MGSKGGLFGCADSFDRLLMLIGAVGSIGEGLAPPITMYVLSGAIDAFGSADQSIARDVVNKVCFFTKFTCVIKFCVCIRFMLEHEHFS